MVTFGQTLILDFAYKYDFPFSRGIKPDIILC
jgi:hypothetical protein